MRSESGQATVEWVALVLFLALGLGALLALAPRVDGRSLGAVVARRLTCAVKGGCPGGERAGPPRRAEARAIAPAGAVAVPPAGAVALPRGTRGSLRGLIRKGARKGVAANGLVCYLRKSTAPNDTNRVGDDIGDAINCMNPIDGWTGHVGGTDD
jgi:hypothetical protein